MRYQVTMKPTEKSLHSLISSLFIFIWITKAEIKVLYVKT